MSLFKKIQKANELIKPYIYETPLEKSILISNKYNTNVFLKCEHLQKTGSFKFRGALNKILSLSDSEKQKGVIAASSGNHGQGVALAAQIMQVSATIYVPEDASQIKIDLIKAYGAKVKICPGNCLNSEIEARKVAEENSINFISPYNDHTVIAGQGTIGIELIEQCQNLDAVFISVGGGGLISGIATYLKQVKPNTKIIACWPENAPTMFECIKAGKIIEVEEKQTLSDGTAGGVEPGAITLPICSDLIDDFSLVSENEIKSAMKLLAKNERFIIEGAAGVAMAGFLKNHEKFEGKNVAIVLCGRNIDYEKYIEAIEAIED